MQTEACNNFKLGLKGGFQECDNCGIDKKFHKLNTAGNSQYIPKNSLTSSTQRQAPPPVKTVAESVTHSTKLPDGSEVIKESQFTSVKDRMRAFEALKNSSNQTSGQYKPSGRASMPPQVTGIRRTETELIPEKVVETKQEHVEKQDEVLKIAEEVDEQLKIGDDNDDVHHQQQQQVIHEEEEQNHDQQVVQEQVDQQQEVNEQVNEQGNQQQVDEQVNEQEQQQEQYQQQEQQNEQQYEQEQEQQEQQQEQQQQEEQQYEPQQQAYGAEEQYQNPMEDDEQQNAEQE